MSRPKFETGMVDPKVGPARIGVGPGDVLIAASRECPEPLPLFIDRDTTSSVRSKWIEITSAGT